MKLHYSPASPYVRKVMVCAIARGIAGLCLGGGNAVVLSVERC